jgi:hypothetical protein
MTSEKSISIIGAQHGDDYRIAPTEHAALYLSSAPELAKLLTLASAAVEAEAYQRHDREAIAAQIQYKIWMWRTNGAVFATTLLGAAALAAAILWPSNGASARLTYASGYFSALATLATGFGGFGLYKLRSGKLLEEWMGQRASAETHRLGYFGAISKRALASGNPNLVGLFLEYFRRYQFDVQKAYYTARTSDHKKSANSTVNIGATGAFIAALVARVIDHDGNF